MSKGINLTLNDVKNVETMLKAGLSKDEIAQILQISEKTVRRIRDGQHSLQLTSKVNSTPKKNDAAMHDNHNELVAINKTLKEIRDEIDMLLAELGVKRSERGNIEGEQKNERA